MSIPQNGYVRYTVVKYINQSINQSINRSINQSVNQCAYVQMAWGYLVHLVVEHGDAAHWTGGWLGGHWAVSARAKSINQSNNQSVT
jgi:hypothetical protein